MKRRGRLLAGAWLALAALLALFATALRAERLGEFPLCEASAATRDPASPRRVWIADNERSRVLFSFELGAQGLESMRQLALPGGAALRDIEALAADGERLLVVSSHSRNKRCEFKPKRWQLRWLRETGGRLVEVSALDSSAQRARIASGPAGCLTTLFGRSAPVGADALCEVLARNEADPHPTRCEAFDIEGAVALPAAAKRAASERRVWLGLRSPRIRGRAVLLRMAVDATTLRFDGVAFIDLGGNGVRELAYASDTLWGIAGPGSDAPEPFTLWGVRASEIVPGATISAPRRQRPLPSASEGLVIVGKRAIVVTDGAQGLATCDVASSQARVGLP